MFDWGVFFSVLVALTAFRVLEYLAASRFATRSGESLEFRTSHHFKNAVIGILLCAAVFFWWLNQRTGDLVDAALYLSSMGV